ncbi:MAG: DNA methyltransferase [Methylococcales bacterium]
MTVSTQHQQLALPPLPSNGVTGFSDPAFAVNKNLPIHRWVPWIAGFSRDFVTNTLTRYLSRPGTVLDPFSGVGTTLVEALLHGHQAVGFEINPYAALASQIKVNAYRLSSDLFAGTIRRFESFYENKANSDYQPHSTPPAGFKTRAAFYSPSVLRKVLIVHDFINSLANPDFGDVFRLAFAATMVRYSNYSYEPSLSRRVTTGKEAIEDFPVGETILTKLKEMADDVRWFQTRMNGTALQAQVIKDSFFAYSSHISPDSIDLVITSPPYLNNYHYNRNTRPQLYWLGYACQPKDFKSLEDANIGKYWQTVRELPRLDLTFTLDSIDLAERLEALRTLHPEKGVYGGNGWANYAASYFNDCHRFALGLKAVLKTDGRALVVLGNSILQGILIPTDRYFAAIAQSVGLELVGVDIPRATRVGNSIIQSDVRVAKAHDTHQLYEAIVELRKQ